MTIKLPSFPRELVGSDRLSLSLSLLLSRRRRRRETIQLFFATVGPFGKTRMESGEAIPLSSPLLSEACLCLFFWGKKERQSVDYYPRHIGSRAAAGETTWSVVTIDSIEIRNPVAGARRWKRFLCFYFLFLFFFSFFFRLKLASLRQRDQKIRFKGRGVSYPSVSPNLAIFHFRFRSGVKR